MAGSFKGLYFSGDGNTTYLELLDISRRMFSPDPEFQNVTMLYTPVWNGFIEGPTWDAWWIQNSYGTTYCALPFYTEPYLTFLQNAQDLWFDQMGDGKRIGAQNLQAPDGSLCDAARPGWVMYKQGDGRVDIHDWGMEFTAAGLLLQSELLLISRDRAAIAHYLPMLERNANFIESRRDRDRNLFLAGPAANLLAPSYAGWQKGDSTFTMAYLSGLSITYIAALDRLIEVEKLAGNPELAKHFQERRALAQKGLATLITNEGYFIKSLDPDGTVHGMYGAEKHGYFEASPNHDAIAFRIADDRQSEKIYQKIASIPGLRRHDLIIANEPGLDDMYDPGKSWLWQHGTWVNGGHWSTCEARMILAYYRLGKYADAQRSMQQILRFARQFRMDNPLVEFGSKVYQPKQPVNLCYDTFGPPAAMIRGLFEYIYQADSLILIPHIPTQINSLTQHFPIRWGTKNLFLSSRGQGPINAVTINGKDYENFNGRAIFLDYNLLVKESYISIILGNQQQEKGNNRRFNLSARLNNSLIIEDEKTTKIFSADSLFRLVRTFYNNCINIGDLKDCYEVKHAELTIEAARTLDKRTSMFAHNQLSRLPEPSCSAADELYVQTVKNLALGLATELETYAAAEDVMKKRLYDIWKTGQLPHD
jgi:hypothetical protein